MTLPDLLSSFGAQYAEGRCATQVHDTGHRHPARPGRGKAPQQHIGEDDVSGWSSEQSPRARRLCHRSEFCAKRALLAAGGRRRWQIVEGRDKD